MIHYPEMFNLSLQMPLVIPYPYFSHSLSLIGVTAKCIFSGIGDVQEAILISECVIHNGHLGVIFHQVLSVGKEEEGGLSVEVQFLADDALQFVDREVGWDQESME